MVSSRRVVTWVCGLLLAAGLAVIPSSTAQAAVTQGIVGTVTAAGRGPIDAGVWVVPVDPATKPGGGMVFSSCNVLCQVHDTGSDGRFELNLPVGRYWLYFSTYSRGVAPEWWQDSATREGSTQIEVVEGAVTTIDPQLERGAVISGTVAQGEADQDVNVSAYLPDKTFPGGFFEVGGDMTDAEGRYEVTQLPPGEYRLHFSHRERRLEGWWPSARTAEEATPVAATPADPVTGIDPMLEPWGSISGRIVRASDGTPVADAHVQAIGRSPFGATGRWFDSVSGPDGRFAIAATAGTYRVFLNHAELRPGAWGGDTTWQSGEEVVVRIAEQTTGIDFSPEPRAMVSRTRPIIQGTARVGHRLSASSSWYPSGGSLAHQWLRDGRPIAGATGPTYLLTPADAGGNVHVRVTASHAGYESTSVWANPVRVGLGILRVGPVPAIRGTYRVGHWLRAVPPVTVPAASASYRWFRDGLAITGASGSTYRLRSGDRDHRVTVRIRLTRAGYHSTTVTAVRTGRVR